MLAVEIVRRWYDYWRERPGTGLRVSSGGTKIIFSDSNTHYRGAEKLSPEWSDRCVAYSEGCILCSSGDVERMGGYG